MLNTYKYNKYVVTGTLPYDYQLTELGQFETIWGNLQIVLQANLPYRACRRWRRQSFRIDRPIPICRGTIKKATRDGLPSVISDLKAECLCTDADCFASRLPITAYPLR